MSAYRMIAFDMDGTLLNTQKKITVRVVQEIEKAVDNGKTVVLSTGRSLGELQEYEAELKNVRYWVVESGALVYDSWDKKILYRVCFDKKTQEFISSVLDWDDVDTALLGMSKGRSCIASTLPQRADHYNLSQYKALYEKYGTKVDDEKAFFRSCEDGFEKINIFCTSPEEREIILRRLEDCHPAVTFARSEISNLECSPLGISKAAGLKKLCAYLDVPTDLVIAAGDADNDLKMLKAVGFPVAMGNANENVKEAAKAVVADNDHDGAAEAIRRYLLA